jgi:hypothetical protein
MADSPDVPVFEAQAARRGTIMTAPAIPRRARRRVMRIMPPISVPSFRITSAEMNGYRRVHDGFMTPLKREKRAAFVIPTREKPLH